MSDALVQTATIQNKAKAGGLFGSKPSSVVLTNGQSFTISGSGFGTKTIAPPIKFDNFKNYTTGALLGAENPDWEPYLDHDGALISEVGQRYAGSKSAYNNSDRHGFNTNHFTFPQTEKVFLSYWWRTERAVYGDGTFGTYWVGKLSRITNSLAPEGNGEYNGLGCHAFGNHNPYYSGSNYTSVTAGGATGTLNLGYAPDLPNENIWVRIDMWAQLSDIGVANGRIINKVWDYGELDANNIISRDEAYQLDTVILGVMHANFSGDPAGMLVNDIYIDNTRKRVELCDNSDYTLSSAPEIQPAVSWSNTEVTVSINTGRYTTGTYYLHVLDDAGLSIHSQEVEIL